MILLGSEKAKLMVRTLGYLLVAGVMVALPEAESAALFRMALAEGFEEDDAGGDGHVEGFDGAGRR